MLGFITVFLLVCLFIKICKYRSLLKNIGEPLKKMSCSNCNSLFNRENKQPMKVPCQHLICLSCARSAPSQRYVCSKCGSFMKFDEFIVDEKALEKIESDTKCKSIFIKNFPRTWLENHVSNMCKKYGTIDSVRLIDNDKGESRKKAFVNFETSSSAQKAVEELNGMKVGEQQLYAILQDKAKGPERHSQSEQSIDVFPVHVKNVPSSASNEELEELFDQFGEVVNVSIRKPQGKIQKEYAFVNFRDKKSAEKAAERRRIIFGGNQLIISLRKASKQKLENAGSSRPVSVTSSTRYSSDDEEVIDEADRTAFVWWKYSTIYGLEDKLQQIARIAGDIETFYGIPNGFSVVYKDPESVEKILKFDRSLTFPEVRITRNEPSFTDAMPTNWHQQVQDMPAPINRLPLRRSYEVEEMLPTPSSRSMHQIQAPFSATNTNIIPPLFRNY